MNYDSFKGGAIQKKVTFAEAVVPKLPPQQTSDFFTGNEYLYEGPTMEYFQDAYDYRPINVIPMYAYEPLLQSRNETFTVESLKRGMSGLGATKDPHDIRKSAVHTLKRHPAILDIYLKGRVPS